MAARPNAMTINVAHASSTTSLHELLAGALDFPMCYGGNWDAFWECIRYPEGGDLPKQLIVKGMNVLDRRLPRDAAKLRRCLEDARREISELQIEFVDV